MTMNATEDTAVRLARLEQQVADLLGEARRRGASAAEASVGNSAGLEVSVRLGEVETVEHTRDNGLGITVYFGHRKGSASTTDLSPASLRDAVAAACTIATQTQEDPCAHLAAADLMARQVPDLDLYHPWAMGVDEAIRIAAECEDAARAYRPAHRQLRGGLDQHHHGDCRLRQQPRLHRRLSHHPPWSELRRGR